jgi:SAM-dependent methyltransferase
MNPQVQEHIGNVVRWRGVRPRRALEVGGRIAENYSLLRYPEVAGAERWCLNLDEDVSRDGITHVVGSANDMHMFEDGSFDLVVSNAMLEHDRRFWLSVAEMRRITASGGLLVIGVPGLIKQDSDRANITHTFRVHYQFDYYRFTRRAVREVLLEGMDDVRIRAILDPPRIVGHGIKRA